MWKAPHCSATRPSRTSASLQSTSTASSAPYFLARSGTAAMSGSSYWPRSAVNAYGTAPFSRIQAIAQQVSRPPLKAIPTRSPTGSESRMTRSEEISTLIGRPRLADERVEGVWGNREVLPHRDEEGGPVGET